MRDIQYGLATYFKDEIKSMEVPVQSISGYSLKLFLIYESIQAVRSKKLLFGSPRVTWIRSPLGLTLLSSRSDGNSPSQMKRLVDFVIDTAKEKKAPNVFTVSSISPEVMSRLGWIYERSFNSTQNQYSFNLEKNK